jgi:hypothetical protein
VREEGEGDGRPNNKELDVKIKSNEKEEVDEEKVDTAEPKSALLQVFEELCDPLLPTRGHALIELAKLVEKRDPTTLSKKDVVQKVFEENLRHGDSYLYLAAINGLSALSNCFPESVVPSLAQEFAGFGSNTDSGLTPEQRLKVGEALMKAIRNLGRILFSLEKNEDDKMKMMMMMLMMMMMMMMMMMTDCMMMMMMTRWTDQLTNNDDAAAADGGDVFLYVIGETVPKYRDVLLAAVLSGARDKDAGVRASSVSNLAELCALLRFSLGSIIYEVSTDGRTMNDVTFI